MEKSSVEIFRDAPVPKAVFSNIIPSIISMLMVLVYNLADTFFIGQTKDAYMVAAVSLGTPVFLIFIAVGMLFGIGGTSLISRKLGQQREKEAKEACSFCFWTGLGVGVVSMIVIWCAIGPLSVMVGASPDTEGYVRQYFAIIAVGVPFLILGNSFSNIIRAEGNANIAMVGMILGNIINIILDPVMILGFGWNVAGAAVATVIGNIVSAAFYVIHLMDKDAMLSIRLRDYKAGGGVAAGVFAIGIPASLNSLLMSTSNIVINNLMKQYGDMAVAGLGVAMKVNMITVMLLVGVGTGIQPLLGYCYGAGNKERFLGVLRFSASFALGLSVVMTVICYCGAGPMVQAFLTDSEAYDYGMQFARVLIISGPVLGLLFVFINTIQAMGAALPSLILSVSRQGLFYLPILLVFNHFFDTARMLSMAQPVTDYIATGVAFLLFLYAYRGNFKEKDM